MALSQLVHHSYRMQDLRKNRHPRAFIQEILHLAKVADLGLNNQLIIIWNRLHVSLRRDVPEPTKHTSLSQFLKQIDSKTAIWYEMAHRPTFQSNQQSRSQQPSNQQTAVRSFKSRNQPPQQQESRAYVADPDIDEYDDEDLDYHDAG